MVSIPKAPCSVCGQMGARAYIDTASAATCAHTFGPVRERQLQSCSNCGHSHFVRWDARITCIDIQDREARKVCRTCEAPLEGRRTVYCSQACSDEFDRNHFWTPARAYAKKRGKRQCVREGCGGTGRDVYLEVNHIVPVVGADRSIGCFNHQDNLEVLCRRHHVEVTNEQRRARG